MIVLLDVDGVIADFMGDALEAIRKVSGKTHTREEVTDWDFFGCLDVSPADKKSVLEYFIKAPGFAYNLEPLPGAVEGVKKIAAIADVFFVTSPWRSSPTWVYDRDRWLVKYFGSTLGRKVIHTEHKYLVRGNVLVDDKPEHVEGWVVEQDANLMGWDCLLWDSHHNKDAHPCDGVLRRVSTWEEVEECVSRLRA